MAEKEGRQQVVPGRGQHGHRYRQHERPCDAKRDSGGGPLGPGHDLGIDLLEQDIGDDRHRERASPDGVDPGRAADPRAEPPVRREGAREGEGVRDHQQRGEDEGRGQHGERAGAKYGGLGVEKGGDDQLADEHDGVDHRNEGVDLRQGRVAVRQSEEERGEHQSDDGQAEPDLSPARRCIEQPQTVLRHGFSPQGRRSVGVRQAGQANEANPEPPQSLVGESPEFGIARPLARESKRSRRRTAAAPPVFG